MNLHKGKSHFSSSTLEAGLPRLSDVSDGEHSVRSGAAGDSVGWPGGSRGFSEGTQPGAPSFLVRPKNELRYQLLCALRSNAQTVGQGNLVTAQS